MLEGKIERTAILILKQGIYGKRITIADDVIIETASIVPDGVAIGRSSTVRASSVVVKDVPPYTIVAGALVKPISKRVNKKGLKLC